MNPSWTITYDTELGRIIESATAEWEADSKAAAASRAHRRALVRDPQGRTTTYLNGEPWHPPARGSM